ncbi:MAG: hypothetical protein ACYC6O_06955 [Thermoleophilia bacterium]
MEFVVSVEVSVVINYTIVEGRQQFLITAFVVLGKSLDEMLCGALVVHGVLRPVTQRFSGVRIASGWKLLFDCVLRSKPDDYISGN